VEKKEMPARVALSAVLCLATVLCISAQFFPVLGAPTAGATTSVRLMRCANDGTTVLAERTVDYRWMEDNLPVQGDGLTHYYHQGPVFEGDTWDPEETVNLKDKGAVKGTNIRDLCDLIGGMLPGEEVTLEAVDGWRTTFAYTSVYEPLNRQGPIALCWYKGEADEDQDYGSGYPGNDAYSDALQIVFMAVTKSAEGKCVFGNSDMQVCLPEEKYQHFYEGLPSTNGLSGKWIDEIYVHPSGVPPDSSQDDTDMTPSKTEIPWTPIALGISGLALIGSAAYVATRKRANEPTR
jgi:hypothetical protein